MRTHFDLIVIGTDVAASAFAHECSAAGWKVGVVDSRSFGGRVRSRKYDRKLMVHASAGSTRETFEADLVVHGAGRVPERDDSDLYQFPSLSRRRSCALTATITVDRFIARAPTLIGRAIPQWTKPPAAAGMAIAL